MTKTLFCIISTFTLGNAGEEIVIHDNLIENGVTDAEDVDYNRVFQQRQQVVGHSLPEVEQKILDLKQNI